MEFPYTKEVGVTTLQPQKSEATQNMMHSFKIHTEIVLKGEYLASITPLETCVRCVQLCSEASPQFKDTHSSLIRCQISGTSGLF